MQTVIDYPRALAVDEGEATWFLGHLVTIKTAGEMTGEAFSVTEHFPPAGFGPPPHIHHNEDEAIYVLEGEVSFLWDDRTFRGGPGSYTLLRRGIAHTYKVEGDSPARLLIVTTPAGFERFVRDSGVPADDRTAPVPPATQADIEKMLATAPRYGIEILPPPSDQPQSPKALPQRQS